MDITKEMYFRNQTAEGLIGKSIGILGVSGSGKSNMAAVLMEEALGASIPICVVDIAGEYFTLKDMFPQVTVIGRSLNCVVDVSITHANVSQVAKTAYENGSSVVFDLSAYERLDRPDLLLNYFTEIWKLAAIRRIPLIVFLEEAHNWVPQGRKTAASEMFVDYATEGRKRGLSLVMIGQRSSRIDKNVLTQADILFLFRVRHPADINVYVEMLPWKRAVCAQKINSLRTGQAYILKGDLTLNAHIRLRHTKHYGDTPTAKNIPENQMSLYALLNKAQEDKPAS